MSHVFLFVFICDLMSHQYCPAEWCIYKTFKILDDPESRRFLYQNEALPELGRDGTTDFQFILRA